MSDRGNLSLFVSLAIILSACVGDSTNPTTSDKDAAVDASTDAAATPDVVDAGAGVDAQPDAPASPCALGKPFGAPTPFDAVNSDQDDVTLRFSADGLRGYFARGTLSASSLDIYVSTKLAGFADGVVLAGVNSLNGFFDAAPTLSANELEIFFQTNDNSVDAGAGFLHVWRAARSATSSNFNGRAPVAALTGVSVTGVYLNADGNTLFFSDFGDGNIKSSARISGSQFGTPKTELAGKGPVVSADGLSVYFTKGTDIWVATRASKSSIWQAPVAVSELNTTSDEAPSDLSPDGCTIYLESNRPTSKLGYNIWVAKKPAN
jgi:hypothetical protein